MLFKVVLSRRANKQLTKVPRHILVLFDLWVEIIETEGITSIQQINGYRDHALKGQRLGQRSSSLNKSWRIIYMINEETKLINIEILEVTHHEY